MSDETNTNPDNLQVGDVVKLKSGGKKMTITSISENEATCFSDDEEKGTTSQNIPLAALEKFDDSPMPFGKF